MQRVKWNETSYANVLCLNTGSGANAVTKTVVEETIIKPDGSKVTRTKETVTSGGSSSGGSRVRNSVNIT